MLSLKLYRGRFNYGVRMIPSPLRAELDFVVLTNTLNQNLSDYARPVVELVVSPVNIEVAPATQLTCLQFPTPDALTRSGDSWGNIQWSISRILRARAYLDLLAFCRPSPTEYIKVTSGTGRGALALIFASHEFNFMVPLGCYTMATHRVLGLTVERASHVRKCSRCNEAHSKSRGSGSSSTVSGASMSGERPTIVMLMDHIPHCQALGTSFSSTIGLSTFLKKSCLKRGLLRGGTCGWRSAVRSGASRDLVWLDFMASHCYLVVDVKVTSARTNTNVPRIGARLPRLGSLALGAQHDKLDPDRRTSALLGTPSVQSVHDYYPYSEGWGPVGA
jgi:hypothetical protein